jgi:hypothetical protein
MAQQKPHKPAPKPIAPDPLRVDPGDARLYARRMQEAKRVGPLANFFRYTALALVVAGAIAAFWNWETLSQLRLDFSELTSLFKGRPGAPGTPAANGELETEVVEGAGVAGVGLPSSIDGEPTEAEVPAAAPPTVEPETVAVVTTPPAPASAEPERAEPEPPPPPVEEPPAGPELFGFGLITRMNVSEADASAAVLVVREGGRRGVSSIVWWTTDDTAKSGSDYVSFDRRIERFAVGEQNRTLRVPIVGDRNVEGPETFFVHLAPGDDTSSGIQSAAQIEVVINDDD